MVGFSAVGDAAAHVLCFGRWGDKVSAYSRMSVGFLSSLRKFLCAAAAAAAVCLAARGM